MLLSRAVFRLPRLLFHTRTMSSLLRNKAYIDGRWVEGREKKSFKVFNPSDGTVVGKVPDLNIEDVSVAISAASEAFQTWRETPGKERGAILRKWYDLLNENADELADIVSAEAGKPKTEALGEVSYANSFIEWFSEEARRIAGEVVESPTRTKELVFVKRPIGVVGLITPWNFPIAMITRKAGAALAAGCTCVIKPAEDTPLTALAVAELAGRAGIPRGVLNVITSDRPNAAKVGKLLCQHRDIAGISFTGSTEVGKILYGQCAVGVKRLALELGGNAPFIVFSSADLDKAADGAIASKFRNCGQTCVSANRFFVQSDVVDAFLEKLLARVDSLEPGKTLGPLINAAQMNKVTGIVQDAVGKGATIVRGGKPLPDVGKLFFAPTVLTGITPDMAVYNEEVFGPVVTIIPFETEAEAIRLANATDRGLAGYFYSENVRQAWRVARQLEVGMVGINEGIISTAEAAFGGIKESGFGREGSHHGIDDFTYIKYMCFGGL